MTVSKAINVPDLFVTPGTRIRSIKNFPRVMLEDANTEYADISNHSCERHPHRTDPNTCNTSETAKEDWKSAKESPVEESVLGRREDGDLIVNRC